MHARHVQIRKEAVSAGVFVQARKTGEDQGGAGVPAITDAHGNESG